MGDFLHGSLTLVTASLEEVTLARIIGATVAVSSVTLLLAVDWVLALIAFAVAAALLFPESAGFGRGDGGPEIGGDPGGGL